MKLQHAHLMALSLTTLLLAVSGCATNNTSNASTPQKILEAAQQKAPNEAMHIVYIPAPSGFIAPRLAKNEVVDKVDSAKVVDLITVMTVKTSTALVIGNQDDMTAATVSRALAEGKEKIAGAKMIYVGGGEELPALSKLASNANVSIEFMNAPK